MSLEEFRSNCLRRFVSFVRTTIRVLDGRLDIWGRFRDLKEYLIYNNINNIIDNMNNINNI